MTRAGRAPLGMAVAALVPGLVGCTPAPRGGGDRDAPSVVDTDRPTDTGNLDAVHVMGDLELGELQLSGFGYNVSVALHPSGRWLQTRIDQERRVLVRSAHDGDAVVLPDEDFGFDPGPHRGRAEVEVHGEVYTIAHNPSAADPTVRVEQLDLDGRAVADSWAWPISYDEVDARLVDVAVYDGTWTAVWVELPRPEAPGTVMGSLGGAEPVALSAVGEAMSTPALDETGAGWVVAWLIPGEARLFLLDPAGTQRPFAAWAVPEESLIIDVAAHDDGWVGATWVAGPEVWFAAFDPDGTEVMRALLETTDEPVAQTTGIEVFHDGWLVSYGGFGHTWLRWVARDGAQASWQLSTSETLGWKRPNIAASGSSGIVAWDEKDPIDGRRRVVWRRFAEVP